MGASEGGMGRRLHSASPAAYRVAAPIYRAALRLRSALEISSLRRSPRWGDPSAASSGEPRVVLDGVAFQTPHGGIARLWAAIMAEWSRSGFAQHVVVLDRSGLAPQLPGFAYRALPLLRVHDSGMQERMLEDVCRVESADVFVSTEYTRAGVPSLLYLYDMTPEVLGWNLDDPRWREKRRAIEQASAYVCLSTSTAHDLAQLYATPADKPVTIALPGIEQRFKPASADQVSGLRERYGLLPRFYLFIGHRDDYKNARLLFEAVELMQDDEPFSLLLLGGSAELEPELAALAGRVPVRIARISDDELVAAYTGAAALVYVSKYEGFGLPIIEAMACGSPVITCRNSSLPEAAGDAAIYVGEDAPRELAAALRQVIDPEIRADLIARGLAHATEFTWTTCAELVAAAITRVASAHTQGADDR